MTDQEIDNALDRVLRSSGTALRNYSVQKNIQDMRDVMRELLTPVQSGRVVTRETIRSTIKRVWENKDDWQDPLVDELFALQLPAPTHQPEARGMDLSGVKRWHMDGENFREVQDPLGDWIKFDDIAHLQQAPQGVGEWIPVTYMLPDHHDPVLCEAGGRPFVACWYAEHKTWYQDGPTGLARMPHHWRPISKAPAPVKVDDHE